MNSPRPDPPKTTAPGSKGLQTKGLGASMTLVASVALLSYGGIWLDRRYGTTPLFLLVGVAWGAVFGILHLLRVLAPELLPFRRRKKPDDEAPPPA
jgi:F0F1-type ATP synthase assembly protein I